MWPALLWYENKTKTLQKKGNDRPVSLTDTDANILKRVVPKWIQQYIKRIIHQNQVQSIQNMQDWYNIWTLINVINSVDKGHGSYVHLHRRIRKSDKM